MSDGETFVVLADEFIGEYDARVRECALHRGATSVLNAVAASGAGQAVPVGFTPGEFVRRGGPLRH